jgi:hypothetical protein
VLDLSTLVADFAAGLKRADAKRPGRLQTQLILDRE